MPSSRRGTVHQHSVLIVEDSDATREALGILFELEGYRVTAAPDGAEAMHLLQADGLRPCVILVDLIMPTMDGLTFRLEQLQSDELGAIPTVALTANEGLRRQALDMGFADVLTKPCNFEQLFALMHASCRKTVAHTGPTRA